MRRTYTCQQMFARHPSLYLFAIAVGGAGSTWQAWIGSKRRRMTAPQPRPDLALTFLARHH